MFTPNRALFTLLRSSIRRQGAESLIEKLENAFASSSGALREHSCFALQPQAHQQLSSLVNFCRAPISPGYSRSFSKVPTKGSDAGKIAEEVKEMAKKKRGRPPGKANKVKVASAERKSTPSSNAAGPQEGTAPKDAKPGKSRRSKKASVAPLDSLSEPAAKSDVTRAAKEVTRKRAKREAAADPGVGTIPQKAAAKRSRKKAEKRVSGREGLLADASKLSGNGGIGVAEASQSVPPDAAAPSAGKTLAVAAEGWGVHAADSDKEGQQLISYKQLKRDAEERRSGVSTHEPKSEGTRMLKISLDRFANDPKMRDQALALYVSSKAFPRLAAKFEKFMMSAVTESLEELMTQLRRRARMSFLFNTFAQFAVDQHSKELQAYRETVNTMDLRKPYLWYPVARSLKRKFIYHAGPTNSGKTYTALQAMMQAPSGVYCGPLRLLAMEVYDTCNAAGTFCNLITGQEKKWVPGAQHTSCTIEMTNTQKRVDVAVVDEVQLLGDESRGWAWTRALQGLPANEIHLCGDGSAIKLARNLANMMDEEFEVREYQRFTPVEVQHNGPDFGLKDVRPGDCVVAFSRKTIYEAKAMIESSTGLRVCLVYGALPPETRKQQARLFNEEDNEYHVMVASDAVGMGLNLNIRRIVFTTLMKSSPTGRRQLSVSEIKQIAGRAGRRNSKYPVGYATCLDPLEVDEVAKAMGVPLQHLSTPAAGLFPEFEHLEAYAGKALQTDFGQMLAHFAKDAQLDGRYFFCQQEDIQAIAKLLSNVEGLSLQERYTFCNAPVRLREPRQAAVLLHFATIYASKQPVELQIKAPHDTPETPDQLHHMESLHQIVSLWLWLAQRFDDAAFPNQDQVVQLSERLIEQMDQGLLTLYDRPEPVIPQADRPRQTLREISESMEDSLVENLGLEARRHLTEAVADRVKSIEQSRNRFSKQYRHSSRQYATPLSRPLSASKYARAEAAL